MKNKTPDTKKTRKINIMNSRRSFIKNIGAGAAFSSVAFSSSAAFNSLTDPGAWGKMII
jgi:hypothetical protein